MVQVADTEFVDCLYVPVREEQPELVIQERSIGAMLGVQRVRSAVGIQPIRQVLSLEDQIVAGVIAE